MRASLVLAALAASAAAYKPVIMMHGVGDTAAEMNTIARLLREEHPGTVATSLPLFEGAPASFDHSLQKQVDGVIAAIRNLTATSPAVYKDGYHLVCHSQGALICRCAVEQMDDHNVDTLVSLAGPQTGVFGPAFFSFLKDKLHLPSWFIKGTEDSVWLVADNALGQLLSVGGYWRDPHHIDSYLKHVTLARFNEHATPQMKANFVRLNKLVCYVGSGPSYDGGIEPWQSGAFGSADATGKMLNMTEQAFYTTDAFGLRTLNEAGKVEINTVPGVKHSQWTYNAATVRKYVIQHCT